MYKVVEKLLIVIRMSKVDYQNKVLPGTVLALNENELWKRVGLSLFVPLCYYSFSRWLPGLYIRIINSLFTRISQIIGRGICTPLRTYF